MFLVCPLVEGDTSWKLAGADGGGDSEMKTTRLVGAQ